MKTRVTKRMVEEIRTAKKVKAKKNLVIPGPWTKIETSLKINPILKITKGMMGNLLGSYVKDAFWHEKGWYPIIFNITSDNIKEEVEKNGINNYLAACESSLIGEKERLGRVILLGILSDNSGKEDIEKRFISCKAKTNKKSIIGFGAIREGKYIIIKEKEVEDESEVLDTELDETGS